MYHPFRAALLMAPAIGLESTSFAFIGSRNSGKGAVDFFGFKSEVALPSVVSEF